jgi:hypothetical protein
VTLREALARGRERRRNRRKARAAARQAASAAKEATKPKAPAAAQAAKPRLTKPPRAGGQGPTADMLPEPALLPGGKDDKQA